MVQDIALEKQPRLLGSRGGVATRNAQKLVATRKDFCLFFPFFPLAHTLFVSFFIVHAPRQLLANGLIAKFHITH